MTLVKFLIMMLLFSGISTNTFSQKLIAATYNIRLQTDGDTGNLWSQRASKVAALIEFHLNLDMATAR